MFASDAIQTSTGGVAGVPAPTTVPSYPRPSSAAEVVDLKLLQVKKEGPNQGRYFWSGKMKDCAESYFQWADEPDHPARPANAPQNSKYLTVKREGPNKGRHFWSGTYSNGGKYFSWADDVPQQPKVLKLTTDEVLPKHIPVKRAAPTSIEPPPLKRQNLGISLTRLYGDAGLGANATSVIDDIADESEEIEEDPEEKTPPAKTEQLKKYDEAYKEADDSFTKYIAEQIEAREQKKARKQKKKKQQLAKSN